MNAASPINEAPATSFVELRGVAKTFSRTPVLADIDLVVRKGEVVAIIGPSGSGKSTLLRCINQLVKVDAGRIWVDGELIGYRQVGNRLYPRRESEILKQRAEVGMVFQGFNLFPHMTVMENITDPPRRVKGVSRDEESQPASAFSLRSGCSTGRRRIRRRCRAGSSSGSLLRAHSR